jgi:hypothetical protein
MNPFRLLIGLAGILLLTQSARAQVPFFFPGARAFTPQISVVNTGIVNDVQATVSADRKYVTLTMRPQNSTLLALREFSFQNAPALGNVGGVGNNIASGTAVGKGRNGGGDDASSAVSSSPSDILAKARAQSSILFQTGMVQVSRIDPKS